jgi:hypothetical protein
MFWSKEGAVLAGSSESGVLSVSHVNEPGTAAELGEEDDVLVVELTEEDTVDTLEVEEVEEVEVWVDGALVEVEVKGAEADEVVLTEEVEDFVKSKYEPLKAITRITIIMTTSMALLTPDLESNFLNKSHLKFFFGKIKRV